MSFRYLAYGLVLDSSLPLPELLSLEKDSTRQADVIIREGQCELAVEITSRERYISLHRDVAVFYWRDVGGFRLKNGREIVVERAPGVADDLLRPFLLSSVLAVLLHQRGFLVLHASAAALDNGKGSQGVIAFMGNSGAGKSTIVKALGERNHLVVSDDIIAVPTPEDFGESHLLEQSKPLIFAGPPYLKLRPPSVVTFGESVSSLQRWLPNEDSYVLHHKDKPSMSPLPLRGLYLLEKAPTIRIEPMEAQDALLVLANNSYCVRALNAQETAHNFFQCSWLTAQVPIFRLQRPHDFAQLASVVQRVEEHQSSL